MNLPNTLVVTASKLLKSFPTNRPISRVLDNAAPRGQGVRVHAIRTIGALDGVACLHPTKRTPEGVLLLIPALLRPLLLCGRYQLGC